MSNEIENDTFADIDIVPDLDFGFDEGTIGGVSRVKKKKKKL